MGLFSKPKAPKESPTSIALRRRQFEQLAELDEEQNTKFKRLLNSAAGVRAFRGSAASRRDPSDSDAGPAPSNYGLVQSKARGLNGKRNPFFGTVRSGSGLRSSPKRKKPSATTGAG